MISPLKSEKTYFDLIADGLKQRTEEKELIQSNIPAARANNSHNYEFKESDPVLNSEFYTEFALVLVSLILIFLTTIATLIAIIIKLKQNQCQYPLTLKSSHSE